jgi:small nuclear ribonucleoprotein F
MSFVPINPRPFLQDLVNKDVIVRLKWGETEYKGRLVVCLLLCFFPCKIWTWSRGRSLTLEGVCVQSIDSYMNIQLSNTEEFIDRKFTGALGQVLIRFVFIFHALPPGGVMD